MRSELVNKTRMTKQLLGCGASLLSCRLLWLVLLQQITRASSQSDADTSSGSVARQWIEMFLATIRYDFARPTVHARNLFHASAAMYDAWAAFDDVAEPYLLGKSIGGFECPFDSDHFYSVGDVSEREEAMTHAAYGLLRHRFSRSFKYLYYARKLVKDLGFNPWRESTNYRINGAYALGNYISDCYIRFGLQDGSNEEDDYSNRFYKSVNPPIEPDVPGNSNILDMDRWQAVKLERSIDQSGNLGKLALYSQFFYSYFSSLKPHINSPLVLTTFSWTIKNAST